MNKKANKIFIICGPSGVGEDSIIDGLEKKIKFNRVVTTVTRTRRVGEKQGKPYYFVSVEKFKQMLEKKEFIEWAIVYGDYRGCTKKEINKLLKLKEPIVWKVDWQGAEAIKKLLPQAVVISIAPPTYKILEERLIKRGKDSLATIKDRKDFTQKWLKQKNFYDYKVVNEEGRLKAAIEKVTKIIQLESQP